MGCDGARVVLVFYGIATAFWDLLRLENGLIPLFIWRNGLVLIHNLELVKNAS